jgi:hypothetical protein
MPSLLTQTTNLKSLKFGNDTPGGGSSNQPYIVTPIPPQGQQVSGDDISSLDFLLRGGMNAARDTATDVVRLTKYFTDLKSPSGVLFASKQTSLSSIAVRTQASEGALNGGTYSPLSTLAQAGVNFIGGHIDKQGVNLITGLTTYQDVRDIIIGGEQGQDNRLVVLSDSKITNEFTINPLNPPDTVSSLSEEILSYRGGPNSNVGLGRTNIKIAQNNQGAPLRTGLNNIKLQNNGFFLPIPEPPQDNPLDFLDNDPGILGSPNFNFNPGGTRGNVENKEHGFDVFSVENQRKFLTIGGKSNGIQDFRREIYKIQDQKISYVTGIAPSYNPSNRKTIDNDTGTSRINYTSPGRRGNRKNYIAGKLDPVTGRPIGAVDRINALPIYKSTGVIANPIKNDLVKFRIAALDSESPNIKEYLHFRAFIDSFSDSYNATWNPQQYMGRGEPLYNYGGFNRDVNMSFTVAAQSKEEIMIMYKKLNFLASNLAPDYTTAGYMAGPLVQLTLGGWCYELPGFIKSMTLEVPQESPWEIAIPSSDLGTTSQGGIEFRNPKLKEMPMICKVMGFTFTPIHNFRPEKQKNSFGTKNVVEDAFGKDKDQIISTITEYGPQRFIQLSNGGKNNNYDQDPNNPITTVAPNN